MMIIAALSPDATGAFNAAALQTAIEQGSALKRPIYIPAGEYTVDAITTTTAEGGTTKVVCEMLSDIDLWGYGARLVLADNQSTDASPTRLAMFFTNQVLTNVSFHGLTLDMNGANNPISPGRPTTYNLYNQAHIFFSGTPGGVAACGTDVLIEDCKFLNTAGVTCIALAQSNTASVTLGKRWIIRGCQFANNGLDTSDHSSIYARADDVLVDGCTFTADAMWGTVGKTGPVVAYEMHGTNHRFVNNVVQNHYQGVWVAANKTSAVENGIIANNVFNPLLAIGVDFAREASDDQPVRKILVCDNTFQFTDGAVAPLGYKMACQVEVPYAIEDIKFCGNLIDKSGTSVSATGLYLSASSVASQVNTGIMFNNNTMRGGVIGVILATSSTNGLGVVEVGGNRFVNLSPSASDPNAIGIVAMTLPSAIKQLTIQPNSFIDDRGGSAFAYGILLGNGTITSLYVAPQSFMGVVNPYVESSLVVTNRSGRETGDLVKPSEAVLVSGVDARNATAVQVVLTAARLVGAPIAPGIGQRVVFCFVQDGTGGRAVTWNAVFKGSWSNTGNTANKRSSIAFVYDGTNWNQDGAQAPYV
jgi:hypothetical protein